MTQGEDRPMGTERRARVPLPLQIAGGAFGTLFLVAAIGGFFAGHEEGGGGPLRPAGVVTLAVMALLAVLLGAVTVRATRTLARNPDRVAPREKRAQTMLWLSGALGGVMGALVVAGDLVSGQASGSPWSGPIPAWVALALAAPLVTILPWLSWLWKRSIDEHERISAFVAAEVAAFAYVIVLPVWWLLWRGGLLGAPDQIAIYVGFIMIYTAIWFYRKHN